MFRLCKKGDIIMYYNIRYTNNKISDNGYFTDIVYECQCGTDKHLKFHQCIKYRVAL